MRAASVAKNVERCFDTAYISNVRVQANNSWRESTPTYYAQRDHRAVVPGMIRCYPAERSAGARALQARKNKVGLFLPTAKNASLLHTYNVEGKGIDGSTYRSFVRRDE